MPGGSNANRASGNGGNYGSKGGGGSSKGGSSSKGSGDSARYATHKSGDRVGEYSASSSDMIGTSTRLKWGGLLSSITKKASYKGKEKGVQK